MVPEFYAKYREDGIGSISYTPKEGYAPVENDQFEAGEVLPLVQLCLTQQQSQNIDLTTSAQALPFDAARGLRAEPKIGAVVNAERFTGSGCQVITTPQGLKIWVLFATTPNIFASITGRISPKHSMTHSGPPWSALPPGRMTLLSWMTGKARPAGPAAACAASSSSAA